MPHEEEMARPRYSSCDLRLERGVQGGAAQQARWPDDEESTRPKARCLVEMVTMMPVLNSPRPMRVMRDVVAALRPPTRRRSRRPSRRRRSRREMPKPRPLTPKSSFARHRGSCAMTARKETGEEGGDDDDPERRPLHHVGEPATELRHPRLGARRAGTGRTRSPAARRMNTTKEGVDAKAPFAPHPRDVAAPCGPTARDSVKPTGPQSPPPFDQLLVGTTPRPSTARRRIGTRTGRRTSRDEDARGRHRVFAARRRARRLEMTGRRSTRTRPSGGRAGR